MKTSMIVLVAVTVLLSAAGNIYTVSKLAPGRFSTSVAKKIKAEIKEEAKTTKPEDATPEKVVVSPEEAEKRACQQLLEKYYGDTVEIFDISWADMLGTGERKEFFTHYRYQGELYSSVFSMRGNTMFRIGHFDNLLKPYGHGNSVKVLTYNRKNYLFIYSVQGSMGGLEGAVYGWDGDKYELKNITKVGSDKASTNVLPGGQLLCIDYWRAEILRIDAHDKGEWESYSAHKMEKMALGNHVLSIREKEGGGRGYDYFFDGKQIDLQRGEHGIQNSKKKLILQPLQGIFIDTEYKNELRFETEGLLNEEPLWDDWLLIAARPGNAQISVLGEGPVPYCVLNFTIEKDSSPF